MSDTKTVQLYHSAGASVREHAVEDKLGQARQPSLPPCPLSPVPSRPLIAGTRQKSVSFSGTVV